MSAYDDLMFAPMLITDVFTPHKGKRLVAAARKPGNTPFVGGSESFNSITGFSDVKPLFPGGWLTLTYNGSVGHARLQPAPFFASDDVIALEPPSGATAAALLMCTAIITRECVAKYSYGAKLNLSRLTRQTAMFPVTSDSTGEQSVDWDGMARLGEALMACAVTPAHRTRTTDEAEADAELPELKFEPMFITDVFDTYRQSPAWLNTNQVIPGEPTFPHVTNSANGNSVFGFIARQTVGPNAGNAVTIGIDTQVVAYQPSPFYGATKVFELRSPNLNEEAAPILVSALRVALAKFSWGHKASAGRLQKTRVMVPVTTDGSREQVVDWDGMTRYGRILRARAERDMSTALTGR